MNNIRRSLFMLLQRTAERLREARVPEALAAQLEQCATQVYQPCVVAVVGQVKAGKSTFINAFLGEELARVGTTETTATINYFRYGKTSAERPVRCYWIGGHDAYVDMDFVNSLQGNDIETLQRANGIARLEYYLDNPILEQITLVDTPGTNAAVDIHQDRTADFLHLEQQLRERHNAETQEIGSKADAIIYLISATAREPDQAFLEEFNQVTQGTTRAFNAIGVMAKIDLYSAIMERRMELAAKIDRQLKENINTVIPVSAGIRQALDRLLEHDGIGLRHLMEAMRRIPPELLDKFLSDEELYLELNPSLYPIPLTEREALIGALPWTVFTTIARICADQSKDKAAIIRQLNELAGFDQLKQVLEQHFFKRSQILRCNRILNDAYRVVYKMKYSYLRELRKREKQDKLRQEQFLAFIRNAQGDPAIALELEALVVERLTEQAKRVEALVEELERNFGTIGRQLQEYNTNFQLLRQLLDHKDAFSSHELDELLPLLGLHGLEIEMRLPMGKRTAQHVAKRQIFWREVERTDENAFRRGVAQQVVSSYGQLLAEIMARD